jgi:tryptophan-rich sensory protein
MLSAVSRPSERSAAPADNRSRWILLAFLVGTQVAGLIGVPFTSTGSWYDNLDKAPFNPPSAVFGPVWTVLYVLVGVAGWLLWRSEPSVARSRSLLLWGVQLVLNAAWTPIFFGAERPGWGLVDLLVLDAAVVAMILVARAVQPRAAAILLPYAAWIAFATALNGWIVVANT